VNAVVVDTSVWIDFFGGRATPRLEEALEVGSIVTPPIVVAELLSGAKPRDRESIVELLRDLETAATPFSHWLAVGDLRLSLQKRGLTVSTPDAHVAQCAIDRDALLLSQDAVFAKMSAFVPLRLAAG
jgi:predicted nucleic acid-binding protein